jgi:hypothetical protein
MILPGWTCACGVFNGEGKEVLSRCRACNTSRLEVPTRDDARKAALYILENRTVEESDDYEFMHSAIALAQLVENGTRVLKEFKT